MHVSCFMFRYRWRSATQNLIMELPRTKNSRESLPDQIDCPLASMGAWEVYPEGVVPQHAITANVSLQLIRETKAHVTIYTDGPATGGTTAGGTAMVATVGDPADPVIIHTSTRDHVLRRESCPAPGSRLGKLISICSDSQSLLKEAHTTPSLFASD